MANDKDILPLRTAQGVEQAEPPSWWNAGTKKGLLKGGLLMGFCALANATTVGGYIGASGHAIAMLTGFTPIAIPFLLIGAICMVAITASNALSGHKEMEEKYEKAKQQAIQQESPQMAKGQEVKQEKGKCFSGLMKGLGCLNPLKEVSTENQGSSMHAAAGQSPGQKQRMR